MKHLALLAAGVVALAAPAVAQHTTVTHSTATTTVSRVHGPLKLLPHHKVRHCQTKWVAHRRVRKCYYR